MPPAKKRKKILSLQLKKACTSKKRKTKIGTRQQREPEGLTELLNLSHDALDTSNDCVDPEFDLESSMKSESDYIANKFCEEWLAQLSWEDVVSLGLFLSFQLPALLKTTKTTEYAAILTGKSMNAVFSWQDSFL